MKRKSSSKKQELCSDKKPSLLGTDKFIPLESSLQEKIIKAIKKEYGRCVWIFKTNDNCRVGIPDLILCFYGHFVAIELKRPEREAPKVWDLSFKYTNKDLSPMQKYNIGLINHAGGSAFMGRDKHAILDKLSKIFVNLQLFDGVK